jgi:Zn-dependent protease/predicted transcriptional regulator
MRNTIQLGKIFGIQIKIDYSWFIIFLLISWSLGSHYFPHYYPGWQFLTYWIVALSTCLIFFACVLAHELSHSLVSKAHGTPVRDITLFIFGGVAQIVSEPERPGKEFFMALAGPLVSIVIAIFFRLIVFVMRSPLHPVSALAYWLSRINLMLAIFNLVPGFPLDGGRLLRAVIWKITGNFKKATRVASGAGRFVAFLLIFFGMFMFFTGRFFNGIWFVFIGWFLNNAAESSYRLVALKDTMRGVTVEEAMVRECYGVPGDTTIEQLIYEHIIRGGYRCLPVIEDGRVVGLVTIHQVKEVPRHAWGGTTVKEVMIPLDKTKAVKPADPLLSVFETMTREDISQLPVVQNGELVGIIGRDNILSFIRTLSELGIE